MLPILTLIVAALAVFFGPMVIWSVAREQIAATSRASWMREFREQVSILMSTRSAFTRFMVGFTSGNEKDEVRREEILTRIDQSFFTLRLLAAETEYKNTLDSLTHKYMVAPGAENVQSTFEDLLREVERILAQERNKIEMSRGVFRSIIGNLR